MASLMRQSYVITARRGLQVLSSRSMADKMLPDPLELATGPERKERMAIAAGNENPFDMRVYKRVGGDLSTPTIVPSFYQDRIIGCICEEDATCVNYMWLSKGETKRCECGYFFKLIDAKPLA